MAGRAKDGRPGKRARTSGVETGEADALNHEQRKLAEWLRTVKFRKALIGGVREEDVWQKLGELNRMYEAALSAERARYDGLLEDYAACAAASIERCKREAAGGRRPDE